MPWSPRVVFAARIASTPWHARAHWNWNLPARLRPCGAQMRTHLLSADASTDRPVLQDLAARFGAFISKYAVQGIPSLFAY